MGPVRKAVEESLAVANLSDLDAAAAAALRALADRIDTEDDLRAALIAWADHQDYEVRPPKQDNVSIPTFLKYCDALGLTPASRRAKSVPGKADAEEGGDDSGASGVSARRRRAAHLRTA